MKTTIQRASYQIKAVFIAALFLVIGVMGLPDRSAVAQTSSADAQEKYLPTQADFIGKWKLSGTAIRPPRSVKTPTPEQETEAKDFQRMVIAFYSAFDYLEITADGHYNFHQPGDQEGVCVWCGTWSFDKGLLWLKLDTAPRLRIFAKDGNMQMNYTAEPDKTSKYTWLIFGWTKLK